MRVTSLKDKNMINGKRDNGKKTKEIYRRYREIRGILLEIRFWILK